MTQLRTVLIGLVLIIGTKPLDAWPAAMFAYVPSLTGNYVVGEGAIPYGGTATLKEEGVLLSWTGGPGPRYLTYELSGVLGEPQPVVDGLLEPYEDPTKINFNGGFVVSPRPGIGWGTTLNENVNWTPGFASFHKEYDPTSGQFYIGLSMDVYAAYNNPCCPPWPDAVSSVIANVYAVFYNYDFFSASVSFLDPGFVFVESARVGLSDLPLSDYRPEMQKIVEYPVQVPEPSTIFLMLAAALGLVAARVGRYPRQMIQGKI